MNKKILLFVTIFFAAISVTAIYSYGMTGFFSKAFSKTVYPNQVIEENITIRKYFNLTVRFRTSPSGNDLTFDDPDGMVVLKDVNGNELYKKGGIASGKAYILADKLKVDAIATISSSKLDSYEDVVDQSLNITFYGTKAYATVLVTKRQGNATLTGHVFDDLTKDTVENTTVTAFKGGSDPVVDNSETETVTNAEGRYSMNLLATADGVSYDIYVKDYTVT
jgi:hypothetical protein